PIERCTRRFRYTGKRDTSKSMRLTQSPTPITGSKSDWSESPQASLLFAVFRRRSGGFHAVLAHESCRVVRGDKGKKRLGNGAIRASGRDRRTEHRNRCNG